LPLPGKCPGCFSVPLSRGRNVRRPLRVLCALKSARAVRREPVGRSSKEATRAYSMRRERLRAQQDSPTALFARERQTPHCTGTWKFLSPIGFVPTQPQTQNSDCPAATNRDCARTIAPSILTSRQGGERERCSPSSRLDQPNGSCPFTPHCKTPSTPFDTERHLISRRTMGVLRGHAFGHGERQLQREARRSVQALAPPFGSSGDSPDRTDAGCNSGE
jgi:hypothetical protein